MRSWSQKRLRKDREIMKVAVLDINGKDTGRKADLSNDVFARTKQSRRLFGREAILGQSTPRNAQGQRTCRNCW